MVIFDLIFRLPEKVLRALIKNDISYQLERYPGFSKLLPPMSRTCGVYGNALYRDGLIKKIDDTNEAIRRADDAVTNASQLTAETLDDVMGTKIDVTEVMDVLERNGQGADAELEFWRAMKQTESAD